MFKPGLHRVAINLTSAIGVLTCISMGLNVTACALSLAALIAWAAFGGALHGPTG